MRATVLVLSMVLVSACGVGQPTPSSTVVLRVVATTTVIADLVGSVGGERVSVTSLVPKGGEVHTFDPAPSDVAILEQADLIVMNGLGLDDWLRPFVASAGAGDIPVFVLADRISPVEHIDGNPHLWLDPEYAVAYVEHIGLKLAELDPDGAAIYENRLNAYTQELHELDEWANEQFSPLTPDRRRIVSFHDAFPYFASAYALEIVDVVVETPGQEPTAAEVARLIDEIRRSGARAILSEVQFSDDLAETVAAETGAVVISDLYTDSLGDPPLDSYVGIMRWDVERIVAALR